MRNIDMERGYENGKNTNKINTTGKIDTMRTKHVQEKNERKVYKIGQWNVRTLYQEGKLKQVVKEMQRYNLDVLGISEVRWPGHGKFTTAEKHIFLYSGMEDGKSHQHGVGILMSPKMQHSLLAWNPINERIITARITLNGNQITIIQCYAPTDIAELSEKESFYEILSSLLNKTNKTDIIILMGDFNAKVGYITENFEDIMGKHGIGDRNENGEFLLELCGNFGLKIGGTMFAHKKHHKVTWVSPDEKTENQIDHICINQEWIKGLLDVRNKRGADIGSDHHLLTAKIQLWKKRNTSNKKSKYKTARKLQLIDPKKLQQIEKEQIVQNLMKSSERIDYSLPIETVWQECKRLFIESCKQVKGTESKENNEWISKETWIKVRERQNIKLQKLNAKDESRRKEIQEKYNKCSKEVKRRFKRDKERYIEQIADTAQKAEEQKDSKELYKHIRKLSGYKKKNDDSRVRDANGQMLHTEKEQMERWKEYFHELMNKKNENIQRLPVVDRPELPIDITEPTNEEVIAALRAMKNGKAAGSDMITADILKIDVQVTADILLPLIKRIWTEETFPQEWREGIIVKIPKKSDLQNCEGWRGVTLLNVISKVFSRILLNRISGALAGTIRKEQAGFRAGYSCIDNINTIRMIIEQSLEYNTPAQLLFIDYERAFDSVDRECIWVMLKNKGVPNKIIQLIKAEYTEYKCRVLHRGQLSEPFAAEAGVKQGGILSPLLFLVVIDNVMHETTKKHKRGLQWNLTDTLEDLEYADDVCLFAQSIKNMQEKVNDLVVESRKVGLKINKGKTKLLTINTKTTVNIHIEDTHIEKIDEFKYLGSIVSNTGGTTADIQQKINKARKVFAGMRNIWRSKKIGLSTKCKVFNACVKSVLLYGSETWFITNSIKRKLQAFVNRCLRNIIGIWWPKKITNRELWNKTGQRSINEEIKIRKYKWIGHTLRKPIQIPCHTALHWTPTGKRTKGRPCNTWRRTIQQETGKSIAELRKIAQDRTKWKQYIETISTEMPT